MTDLTTQTREAATHDLGEMEAIEYDCLGPHGMTQTDLYRNLYCEDDYERVGHVKIMRGELAGHIIWADSRYCREIVCLTVDDAWRRQGIGTELLGLAWGTLWEGQRVLTYRMDLHRPPMIKNIAATFMDKHGLEIAKRNIPGRLLWVRAK